MNTAASEIQILRRQKTADGKEYYVSGPESERKDAPQNKASAAAAGPANRTPGPAPKLPPRKRKVWLENEQAMRRCVGGVAAAFVALFLGSAIYSCVTESSFVPLRWGSGVLIELALELLPAEFWPVAVVHNIALAIVWGCLFVAVTFAYTAPPTFKNGVTLVLRRQVPFVLSEMLGCAVMLGLVAGLHQKGFTLVAGVLEGAVSALLLKIFVQLFVPNMREYIAVERYEDKTVLIHGGGLSFSMRGGFHTREARTIVKQAIVEILCTQEGAEGAFGLAGLTVFRGRYDASQWAFRIDRLAAFEVVRQIAEIFQIEHTPPKPSTQIIRDREPQHY